MTFKTLSRTRSFTAAALIIGVAAPVLACTSLLVGKNASTDGSTIITYAADSHVLYGELYHQPAADHPKGAKREIREWDTNKHLGYIPEVEHTYSVTGNMNEKQLAISESTWGGRPELVDTTGIMDYGSLIYVTLQRAKTAREAIKIMTDLVQTHGYASSGESFSIADPNEIWIMDLIGKGSAEKGAVWVARRIPDNAIAGHANNPRIHKFSMKDKENTLYSKDVISFARKKGYFNGKDEDFSFSNVYAPADFSAHRGCDARVWSFFNRYAEGMDKYVEFVSGGNHDAEVLPLYVIPTQKLSVQNVKDMMRDHYEGTPFDMTKDVGAGPWDVPYRFRPMTFKVDGKEYTNERAIATQQTGFSFVAQMRSWLPNEIGGILWFGVDDADFTVYNPMYCAMTAIPECYAVGNGDLYNLSWTAAFWVHNWVANQAYSRYSLMIPDIRKVQSGLENELNDNQKRVEEHALALYKESPDKAIKYLNDYSKEVSLKSTTQFRKLGEFLLVKFLDGNRKKETNGVFKRTDENYPASPDFPGYNERYYRSIIEDAGERLQVK